MERISEGSIFSKSAFLYLFSRIFERASFYGFRAILVLFMTSEVLNIENHDALKIYGWFTFSMIFSHVIGGLVSDLKLGNKNGIILGGTMQAAGAFVLVFSNHISLYLGIFLFLIGEGFYTPNIQAQFGKLYLSKTRLLDPGFLLFHIAVILGSAFGPLIIGKIGLDESFSLGFIFATILSICSILFIAYVPSVKKNLIVETKLSIKIRAILLSIIFISIGIYWMTIEIGNQSTYYLIRNFSDYTKTEISPSILQMIQAGYGLPVTILAIIIWSYFYYNQFWKLSIGFTLATIGFAILVLISDNGNYSNVLIFSTSMFLLSVAEIHISPIILSISTKYTNPKYLATILSLSMLPIRGLIYISGLVVLSPQEVQFNSFWIPAIIMGVMAILVVVFLKYKINRLIN